MVNALNVRIILILSFFFCSFYLKAQDIHFSQTQTVQQLLNPASTGVMNAQMRFSMNYRNQWRNLGFPFVSNYLSLEGKTGIFNRPFGIGAFLLHDQSSGNYLKADKIFFSVSHSFFFHNNQIVIGIQPGLVIKSLDVSSITFGSQFDPDLQNYNPGLPSGENLLNQSLRYFDLNTGVLWRSNIKDIFYTAGFSISHINRPKESFYAGNAEPKLPFKFTLHGNVKIALGERYSINPRYMYSSSSGTREFIGGVIGYYYPKIKTLGINNLYSLLQVRVNPPENVDAFIVGAGSNFHSFNLCASYDLTVSSLRKAPGIQGAFELSLVYSLFRQKNNADNPPCFMM